MSSAVPIKHPDQHEMSCPVPSPAKNWLQEIMTSHIVITVKAKLARDFEMIHSLHVIQMR